MTRASQNRRRPWRRRWFLLIVVIATVAAGAWRFASTSIPADRLVPYLEAAVAATAPGLEVDIGGLSLTWAGWRRGLDLLALDTRVAAGDAEIRIPEILLKLSLRALARGRIAPTQVELVGVSGKLIRERDGTIRLVALGESDEQDVGEPALERLFADLGSEPDPQRPLSYMRNLGLRDAAITFEDRSLGVTWAANAIAVNLYSALDTAVAGEFRATVPLGESNAVLHGTLGFDVTDELLRVDAHFADIPAEAVGDRIPAMREAMRLKATVAGSVTVATTLAGQVRELGVEMDGTAGTLSVTGVLDEPEPVRRLRAVGRYSNAERRWQIDPVRLEMGTEATPGAVLSLRAEAGVGEEETRIDTTLDVAELTVVDLGRYWPENLDPGTRTWIVERIDRGVVRELQATARVHAPHATGAATRVENLQATFRYEDLRVRWGDQAPPVEGIGGTATYADHELRFAIDGGFVDDVQLGAAQVDLTELDKKNGHIQIAVDGRGTLAEVLRAIDLRPPPFIRTPTSAADLGSATASFRGDVGFYMQKGLRFEHLDLDVHAELQDVPVVADLAQGTTSGTLHVVASRGATVIDADLDLRGLTSGLRVLGWNRLPEDEGSASFTLTMEGNHPRELRAFAVDTKGLRTTGTGVYAEGSGDLAALTLRDLESGRTSLRHVQMTWGADALRVDLADGSADLVPLFGAPDTFAPGEDGRALVVSAERLARVWLHADGGLENLSGRMRRDSSGWQELALDAEVPEAGDDADAPRGLRIALRPAGPAGLSASLVAGNFGGLLRALGWGKSIADGTLRLESADLTPRLDHGTVRIDAAGFSLADAPLAVRLLSLASLDTVLTTLQGGNLFFDELSGEVEIDETRLGLVGIRANGSSLGWVARGDVDLGTESLAIDGTLIPAYTANRFLQSLPVLREVIVGEGILAVDFEIVGTLAEPEIDTLPLSAITPELLRGVFGRSPRLLRRSP